MDRQSSSPGPGIGWGFGAVGFAATVLVGWLIGAGVGFVLSMLVFWTGVGALFAFLVERSTIEEHDRVDELQNTRLATLAPQPARAAEPARPEPVAGDVPAEPAPDDAVEEPRPAARRSGVSGYRTAAARAEREDRLASDARGAATLGGDGDPRPQDSAAA